MQGGAKSGRLYSHPLGLGYGRIFDRGFPLVGTLRNALSGMLTRPCSRNSSNASTLYSADERPSVISLIFALGKAARCYLRQ